MLGQRGYGGSLKIGREGEGGIQDSSVLVGVLFC